MSSSQRRARRGFTLVEIVVAMTLTLVVFAITLPFLRAQTRAMGTSAGRLDADQIARYAQRAIDRDLRLATADAGQPLLVYAGPMGISFNANLFAVDDTDPNAADIQAGAATSLTDSWRVAAAAAIPRGGRSYPAQDYVGGDGSTSRNETISYFLHPDTITGRSDIYVLYRRVNARDSVQIVRALQLPADSAFFSYFRPVGGTLTRIASSRFPLYWDSTAIDSITSVGLRATGYYKERTTGVVTLRTVQWRTGIPNSLGRSAGCGAAPGASTDFDARRVANATPFRVELEWEDSPDEASGANDVRHYVIEWRDASTAVWSTLATVPASGLTDYEWHHEVPLVSGSFQYGVRAVDCGGAVSSRRTASSLSLPR